MKDRIKSLFKGKTALEEIEPSIFSVIPQEQAVHHYDAKANIYDAIVGNRFYNRLIWGNWPGNYRAFCRTAIGAGTEGAIVDVGCGSLVFTHEVYAEPLERPLILLDRSLGMLRKGKQRLLKQLGELPDNLYFIQGDALDLPFKSGSIETVISFGLLHIFDQPERLLNELMRIRTDNGHLFATSLVANNWLGGHYLNALRNAGEVGNVHSDQTLLEQLCRDCPQLHLNSIGNMAYLGLQARHVEPQQWVPAPT